MGIIPEVARAVNAQKGAPMPDAALLQALLPGVPLQVREETVSTNSDARAWLLQGAPHGSLVAASRQTGGRGRMGRAFVSSPGGLYMSLVLRSGLPAGMLTTLCAVAVRRAVLALTGTPLDIKWVNDLLLHEKKVCGILCEGAWEGERSLGVIAGIGLNVSQGAFPPELQQTAASLYLAGKAPVPLERFAAAIHREVLSLLPASPGHMAEYRAACITLGQCVCWQDQHGAYQGVARAVEDSGALIIDTGGGSVTLAAGEVSIRPALPD